MRLGRVSLGGSGIGDRGPQDDKCRAPRFLESRFVGRSYGRQIVAVAHFEDVPTIGFKSTRHVLRKAQCGIAVDGYMVVIVNQIELSQTQVPGERGGFTGDPLHEITVAGECPHSMIHHNVVRAVEVFRQKPLGDRHANRIADTLTQWSGGGLYPGVCPRSGCPGVRDPHCRKFLMSSSERS